MKKQDLKRFLNAMAAMEQNFFTECSEEKTKLYFNMLSDLSIEEFEAAVYKIINESLYRSFPTIGMIRQALYGSIEDQATIAWYKVIVAMKTLGAYESIEFDDAVIHSVIEFLGGWPKLCRTTEDEMKWKEKEFVNLYKVLRGRQKHPQYTKGLIELSNRERGFEQFISSPKPLLLKGFTGQSVARRRALKEGED